MQVFLIGASGVIGRRVLPMLVAQGHRVTAVMRPGSRPAKTTDGVTSVLLDIFDVLAAGRAMRDHDAVINLATRVPTGTIRPLIPGAWAETTRIRRDASSALTLAASDAGVSRFIQESFAPIYADCGDRWIDESSTVSPASYNRSVLDAEQAAEHFATGGRSGVVLRFAFFYGENDPFTHAAIESIRRRVMPFFGHADAYISMVHHEDAASAAVAALALPSGVYNVVEDEPSTRRELGDTIAQVLGVKSPRMLPAWVAKLAGPVGETIARSLRISNRKLRDAAGWTARYPNAREGWRAAVAGN